VLNTSCNEYTAYFLVFFFKFCFIEPNLSNHKIVSKTKNYVLFANSRDKGVGMFIRASPFQVDVTFLRVFTWSLIGCVVVLPDRLKKSV